MRERRIYKAHSNVRMEDFVVTCQLVLSVPHLRSGSCTSPRAFALGFLSTSPHDDAVALPLPFGFSYTWREDFHLTSYVPCPAHTLHLTQVRQLRDVRLRFPRKVVDCYTIFGTTFSITFGTLGNSMPSLIRSWARGFSGFATTRRRISPASRVGRTTSMDRSSSSSRSS